MNKPVSLSNAQPAEWEVIAFFKEVLMEQKPDVIRFLETYPAAIEEKNNYGQTALVTAAEAGLADMVALLLARGACVEAQAKNRVTSLMWAAEQGYDEVIRLLLEKGVDVNHKDDVGETALMWAARNECKSTIELLLENGASLSEKNNDGETALTIAREAYEAYEDTETSAVITLLEQWSEKQRKAEQHKQFLKDTDFSKGLEKSITKPRPFKLPKPGA